MSRRIRSRDLPAYCITMKNHPGSVAQMRRCLMSSSAVGNDFDIEVFEATTVDTMEEEYKKRGMVYRWDMTNKEKIHMPACTMSHIRVWEKALDGPVLLLEHDAVFNKKFDHLDEIMDSPFSVVSLYPPNRGKEAIGPVENGIQRQTTGVMTHGYVIKPEGARQLLHQARTYLTQHDRKMFCHNFYIGGFVDPIVRNDLNWAKYNLNTTRTI